MLRLIPGYHYPTEAWFGWLWGHGYRHARLYGLQVGRCWFVGWIRFEEKPRLSPFEHCLLRAVRELQPNAYGVPVRQWAERERGRLVSVGAVYVTLDRLEERGLVESWCGDPTPERGGRCKRFWKLTEAGEWELERSEPGVQVVPSPVLDAHRTGGDVIQALWEEAVRGRAALEEAAERRARG